MFQMFVFSCLLLFFTGSVCLAGKMTAPKFRENNPKYLEIPSGEKCKLRCPVSGNPKPHVEWFKESANGTLEPMSKASSDSMIIIRNNLHIDNFTENHEGIYICKASNSLGTISNTFTVKLAEPYLEDAPAKVNENLLMRETHPVNFPPYFTGHMNELVSRPAGSIAVLKCSANANPLPRIDWLRNGKPMSNYTRKFGKEVVYRKFAISIDELDTSDSANYSCVVTNNMGSIKFTFLLEVKERIPHRPIFTDAPSNQTIEIGGQARFECKFISDLQPRVLWLKHFSVNGSYSDDSELPYVEPVQTDSNGTDPYVLIIDNVQFEDEGYYTCLAANSIGISYRSGFLKVLPKKDMTIAKERKTELTLLLFFSILFLFVAPVIGFILYRCKVAKKKIDQMESFVIKKVVILERPSTIKTDMNSLSIPTVKIDYQLQRRPALSKNEERREFIPEYVLPEDENLRKFEFPRKNLKLGKVLGEGAFACVFKAEADSLFLKNPDREKQKATKSSDPNLQTTVAVKMLKENHTDADMQMLVEELELLKVLSETKHKNVVNLLGCCTKAGPLYLLVEYCEKGNLRDYLRLHRNNSFTGYEEPIGGTKTTSLTLKNLINYAYQVARGMEFLTSLKFIHRDLAARNVLLTNEDVVKIADFGLAREIEDADYYKTRYNGKLPVKWMSPEAISERRYSEKSDVWSYGVLLYEIFTLGGTPYPAIAYEKLYEQLKLGHRMAKPEAAPIEVYLLMRNCWNAEPADRPTFSEIVADVDKALLSSMGTEYLELDVLLPVLSTPEDSSSSEDS